MFLFMEIIRIKRIEKHYIHLSIAHLAEINHGEQMTLRKFNDHYDLIWREKSVHFRMGLNIKTEDMAS